jgi:hypothetical protein
MLGHTNWGKPQAGIQIGDKILQIDNVTTSSLSHKIVAGRLAAAADQILHVYLVLSRDPNAPDEELSGYSAGDTIEAIQSDNTFAECYVEAVGVQTLSVIFAE